MGSKRSKKSKQEQELLSDKNNSDTDDALEPEISGITENGIVSTIAKAPKRKKKIEGLEEVPRKVKKTSESDSEPKKNKKRKVKFESVSSSESEEKPVENHEGDIQKNIKNEPGEKRKEEITWPDADIVELINRIESNIPEKDALSYRSRVDKLNWNNIAFNNYNPEQCKKTWLQVQKRIRRFRLLRELINDAKEWINTPKTNHKVARPRKHPDMPRRPLSSYLLFYLKKKDQILSENPGLDGSDLSKIVGQIYKNLPPEKREKYEKMAATNREEYVEKLKIFFENHPEFVPPQRLNHKEKTVKVEKEKLPKPEKPSPKVEKEKPVKIEKEKVPKVEKEKTPKVVKEKTKGGKPGRPPRPVDKSNRPPKKCQTPFGLYYASELKNMEAGTDKHAFKEKCKAQYKQMSDKKKVYWINLAEEDLIRYQEEVKAYKLKNPDYKPHKVRSILTKREKVSKERAQGKPAKPPNSAYALFSRVMLQSEQIKSVNPKDRMNYIANKWRTCTEEEQNSYRDQVVNLMAKYKQDYQAYVETLPEEEQRKILAQKKRKRRSGRRSFDMIRKPRKRKSVKNSQPRKLKFAEPEQPPISPCKYFATLYKGEDDPTQAWKLLSVEEKRKYEEELVKKKQAYIVEFEKFLKSLSKEELEEFSRSRQQQVQSDDDESSECSSGSEGEDEDDEGQNEGRDSESD
ncbi:nucleolar transcription factor 1-like [Tribolium madens]|uniref:nucleolar transcription factor 1-like n=1 Tax=Tribolium madens TaxID=41895 RepID=UPI001CF730B1|nr:nucleolar transcription factor 1-like [Tribolium madens]